MRVWFTLLVAAILLAACTSTGSFVATPGAETGETPAASQAIDEPAASDDAEPAEPSETQEPAATEPPADGPKQYKPGDTIVVTNFDEEWAEITVSKVKTVKSYKGRYYTDKPEQKGHVFLQAFITYKALTNGVNYNPFDWQVFANGEAIDEWSLVTNGPKPRLSSGTLPKGRTASGWVVYEVPAKGEVLLSYGDNMFTDEGPVFEVKVR